MYEAAGRAVERARSGGGPTFLECLTYRLGGHTFGAAVDYMDEEELAQAEADEPVGRYRRWLNDERGIPAGELDTIDEQVTAEVEAAVEAAAAAPVPSDDELQTDVFADPAAVPA
jgi:pyruvate dehydrogenase E1 component alpha subunit